MLTVSLKINPKCSKRKINDVDISSGQGFMKSRDDLYSYAKTLGDCSIVEQEDHSFHLTVRSFNKSTISNEFIQRFVNDKEDDKKEDNKKEDDKKEILFCRKDHEEKYLFRGKMISTFLPKMIRQKRKKTNKKSKTTSSCRICIDKKSNCTFYPCGHVCLCDDCKQDYEKRFSTCPLCKQNYTVCFRIYF